MEFLSIFGMSRPPAQA